MQRTIIITNRNLFYIYIYIVNRYRNKSTTCLIQFLSENVQIY